MDWRFSTGSRRTVAWLAIAITLSIKLPTASICADVLTWDANTTTTGAQDGAGTWSAGAGNWFNTTTAANNVSWVNNPGAANIAQFGVNAGGTNYVVTINGTVNVGGINFLPVNSAFGNNALGYSIGNNSGTLAFDDNAVVKLSDTISGANTYVLLNPTAITGNNVTFQKAASTTAAQRIRLSGTNVNLLGTLTAKGTGGGVGLQITTNGAVQAVTKLVAESGGAIQLINDNETFTRNLELVGTGLGSGGALLFTGNNITQSGNILITGATTIGRGSTRVTATISGVISEAAANTNLTFFERGNLVLTGQNTYTGITANRIATVVDSTLTLDFSTLGGGTSDILYNGVAANTFRFEHTNGTGQIQNALVIQGAATGTNSQRLGNIIIGDAAVAGFRTSAQLSLLSGANNTLNLTTGNFTKSTLGSSLRITGPASGTIIANNGTSTNGLVGTFAVYSNASGGVGGWAAVTGNTGSGGTLGVFQGDTVYTSGNTINAFAAATHLAFTNFTSGNVAQSAANTLIGSLTMRGTINPHTVVVGTGNTLRLGELGGIQMLAGAADLTIGAAGNAGSLTIGNAGVNASGAPFAATDLALTNISSTGVLTINSVISNNGTHATNDVVHLLVNGSGKVILAGANTFTGNLMLHSGILELRNSTALGATTTTNWIYEGAQLQLSGGITIADAFSADGSGDGTGAFRNLSGNNTLAGVITGANTKTIRFHADAGSTLNLDNGGAADTNIVAGTNPGIIFDGPGTIVVANRIATTNGTLTKEGTGTLVLNGDNTFAGTININAGVLRVGHANALNTAAAGALVTIADGATLEFVGGVNMSNASISAIGLGTGGQGAIYLASGNVDYAGLITVQGAGTTRIKVDAGATLTLNSSTNSIRPANPNVGRTLNLNIAGTLNVAGVIAISAANNRTLPVVKVGPGTVNYRNANTYTGLTTVSDGILRLDFANATPTSNLILAGNNVTLNGGTLHFAGKDATANTQTLSNLTAAVGRSSVELTPGSAGSAVLNIGSLTRGVGNGAVLDFNLSAGGTLNTLELNWATTLGAPFTFNKSTWAVSEASLTADVPFDITTDVFTAAKTNGEQITFTGAKVPTGVTAGTTYYVVNSDGTTFQVATSLGGAAIDLTEGVGTTTLVVPGPIAGLTAFSSSIANNDFVGGGDIDVTTSTSQAARSVNSVRFAAAGASTVTLSGTLTLPTAAAGSSGILVTSGIGAFDVGFSSAAAQTIRLGTGNNQELVIHQHNEAGSLVFGPNIIINGGNATRIIKTGAGNVLLQGSSANQNLQFYLYEGSFTLEGRNRFSHATIFPNLFLGSGSSSGKLVLRSTAAGDSQTFDGVNVAGSGTGNAIVGGGPSNYTLRLTTGSFDLTNAKLGGAGTGENNLNLTVAGGAQVTLGPSNTFAGDIRVDEGRLLVNSVADPLAGSSFGTGTSPIPFGESNVANLVVGLEYLGSGAGSTSRALELTNSQASGTVLGITLELVNSGLGSIAFTNNILNTGTNTGDLRTVRLTGTSTAANSIGGVDELLGATTNLDKTGVGRWIITGESFHIGATNIYDGTLQLGNGGAAGSLAASPLINLGTTSSRLRTSRSNTLVISQEITGGGGVEIANTADGRTVLTNSGNDYIGPTTVTGGTLTVDGAIAGSGVTVGPGSPAALNGSGTINSPVRITAGGSFSAGSSPVGQNGDGVGQLTLAQGLSLDAGATLVFDFSTNSAGSGTAGTDWDFIHLTGGLLRLNGDRFTVYVDTWNESLGYGRNDNVSAGDNFSTAGTYQWHWLAAEGLGQRIVDADGNALADGTLNQFQFVTDRTGTGVFAPGNYPQPLGGQFWVSKAGNDLYINYSSVPEPGSLALMSIAAAALAYRRRTQLRALLFSMA
ncbi:MAG: autotransporter-associated beta strand repeat-containing protein [Planctomycetaceae bacterium]|nr:autotransporter-associated beta strand repeat-containing protein [Planctomycetaceae bacterium]